MKKRTNYTLFLAGAMAMVMNLSSCDNNDDPVVDNQNEEKQLALEAAEKQYTNEVVIATYKGLADACEKLQSAVDNLTSDANVQKACDQWRTARKFWEWSEAFLYGAASGYGIDPHIDTWPFDETSFATHLSTFNPDDEKSVANMENTVATGQNLTGFHALEWLIFREGKARKVTDISKKDAVYAQLVAADLYLSSVRLLASWAGIDNVSTARKALLEEAEMEPDANFGEYMIEAGNAGSIYKSRLAAAIQIIDGCRDIADEVAHAKIGKPATGEDVTYIESPHAYNSIVDFYDNILSCKHALYGAMSSTSGDFSKSLTTPNSASVMAYAMTYHKEYAEATIKALDAALTKIEAMKAPFVTYYTDATAKAAISAIEVFDDCLGELEDALSK